VNYVLHYIALHCIALYYVTMHCIDNQMQFRKLETTYQVTIKLSRYVKRDELNLFLFKLKGCCQDEIYSKRIIYH